MEIKPYIDLLRDMVRIPSLSFEEDKVCALISERFSMWGIKHRVCRGNIVAVNRLFNPSLPTLALDAHMDTVPANSGYTRDPLDPGTEEDIVWGLGSNDDGGSVVSMTAAFRHFYDKELPFNLMLIISREEERSGEDGARWLFGPEGLSVDVPFPRPDWVIVGEPTGMEAATSERGLLVIDAQARGVSGHAARNEGVNALYIALEDIEKLRNFKFDRHSEVMGDVKLTVTQIQAGTVHNVVPDSCRFVIDIRPTEKYDNKEILDMLQACCKSTLTARNLANRSSVTPSDSALMATVRKLGIPCYSSPTTSDWVRIRGCAVKMGPGQSSRSHKADEFIMVSEIENAINGYIEFIQNFNGNSLE